MQTLRRAADLDLLGEYGGSGYREARYLVVRPDGQAVHLTRLLYLVLQALDGARGDGDAAKLVSAQVGRELTEDGLRFVAEQKLAPLGLLAGGVATSPRADPVLRVRLHTTLIPVRAVRLLGALIAPLFHPVVVGLVLTGLVAADALLVLRADLGAAFGAVIARPSLILAVVAVMIAASLFHEVGHAGGCVRGGGRPGRIGIGLYIVFPAFYTDVTDAYRLSRRGRLRTDFGGVYFSAIAALAAAAGYLVTGSAVLLIVTLLAQTELLQQLLPVVRLDGYFILGDIVGIPDLFGRIRPVLTSLLPGRPPHPDVAAMTRRARRIVATWVLTVVPLLAVVGVLLALQTPTIFASTVDTWRHAAAQAAAAWSGGDPAGVVLALLTALLAGLPAVGIVLMALLLVPRIATVAVRHMFSPARSRDRLSTKEPAMTIDSATDGTTYGLAGAVPRPESHAWTGDAPPVHGAFEFTEETMLRPRATPPAGGWRRAVYRVSLGGINPGPTRAEIKERELLARARTPVHGTRRVVVISRKGGVGKTTTTLMLGHTFASVRGDRVVALDANPDAGNLGYRVPRETAATLTTLREEAGRVVRYADVRAYTSQAETRLEVIASDDDPRITSALGAEDYKAVIDVLDRHYTVMLLDTGTGILDDAIQGILGEADQIVVVMPPALDGARVAASTLDWLEEHQFGALVKGAVAVVNGVRPDAGLVDLKRLDDHFASRCASVVHIPWDRTLEAGAQVPLGYLSHPTRRAYLQLAAAVAEQFRAGQR